jgi:preprotein translocase subunit SecG
MQTLLLTLELIIAVLLIIFVLLQRSEGGALGIGGSGGGGGFGGLFSPRGASDTLTRTTSLLAIAFFVVCLALNLMVAHGHKQQSLLDSPVSQPRPAAPVQRPAAPAPAQQAPAVPTPH